MDDIEWRIDDDLIPYPEALAFMEKRAEQIRENGAPELIWFLQHPPLYTAGTSAQIEELIDPNRFPIYDAGRGGRYTYHGPGQRVGYVLFDLKKRGSDIKAFVCQMEQWLIDCLAEFNIKGERRDGRIGVWVETGPGVEKKIAAIGVRVRKWVTYHGFALNVEPDLSHFGGIIPCGLNNFGVTSLVDLGYPVTMFDADNALKRTFAQAFSPCLIDESKAFADKNADSMPAPNP